MKEEKELIKLELKSAWERIVKDISEEMKFSSARDSLEWLQIVMENNVPFGKLNRALILIYTYRQLVKEYTPEQNLKACIAAWCSEILQTACLMADDIMDSSLTRRGKLCWYLREDIGASKSAINDCFMLENFIYVLLKKYMADEEYYVPLMESFHQTTLQTTFGQCMDLKFSQKNGFKTFTMEKYSATVQHKTSYYTFYFPIANAMIMAGVKDQKLYSTVEEVTLKMGFYFQVQDDFLDCYGDSAVTGKIGTDIQSRKCTWLLVTALENASNAQRELLEDCYTNDPNEDSTRKVKQIFLQLGIRNLYEKFEAEQQNLINKLIAELPKEIPKSPLNLYASFIFGREK